MSYCGDIHIYDITIAVYDVYIYTFIYLYEIPNNCDRRYSDLCICMILLG